MLCRVISCCVKFARGKKFLAKECCTTEHLFCSQRCCLLFFSFERSSNFVEFLRGQGSLTKCLARLTTIQKRNRWRINGVYCWVKRFDRSTGVLIEK